MTAPQQQKLKATGPVVITANRLSDGKVVYRTGEGDWDADLERAAAANPSEAPALLSLARADRLRVVDPYAASVILDREGRLRPANLRERLRQGGPSIALPEVR